MGNAFTARKVEFEVQPNNQRPIIGKVKFVYFVQLEMQIEILRVNFTEMLGRITR